MKRKRETNLELLRVLCILFIIIGHIGGRSGIEEFSTFAHIAPHAVNCFILISGYFLITAKFKFERVLRIIFETIFYTFIITLALFLLGKANCEDLCKSIFPFAPTKFNYWFVTKYIALVLLSPFIQKICTALTKKQYLLLLGTVLLTSSTLLLIFPFGGLFCDGFSLYWMITLFITGGYLRLHYNTQKVYWGTAAITFLIIYNICSIYLNGIINLGYNSLITYILAICTFMYFKNIAIPQNGILDKVTTFIAPHVFATYLIHEQGLLRVYLQQDICREFAGYMPNGIYLYLFCIAIFLLSVIIDKGRALLFEKVGVNSLITKLSSRINKAYNGI